MCGCGCGWVGGSLDVGMGFTRSFCMRCDIKNFTSLNRIFDAKFGCLFDIEEFTESWSSLEIEKLSTCSQRCVRSCYAFQSRGEAECVCANVYVPASVLLCASVPVYFVNVSMCICISACMVRVLKYGTGDRARQCASAFASAFSWYVSRKSGP